MLNQTQALAHVGITFRWRQKRRRLVKVQQEGRQSLKSGANIISRDHN